MAWRTASSGALSPGRLARVRRDVEILELYRRGLTFDQIARLAGYANPSGPHKAVKRALALGGEPRDRDELVGLEYLRLEALHQVLWSELFDTDPSPRRADQLTGRLLRVGDLEARLTSGFTRLRSPGRRRPARETWVWTASLQQRLEGATLDEVAAGLGLSHRSVARRRLLTELADYAAGPVQAYRVSHAERLDAMQAAVWDDATTVPVKLVAVDEVLGIIARRIRVLGLDAAPPDEPRARRSRRPPPPPGPNATIVVHEGMDPAERANIEALIDQRRQCEPGDVSPPTCVTDEQSQQ